jgi:long-chain acyl-CoA synthetase
MADTPPHDSPYKWLKRYPSTVDYDADIGAKPLYEVLADTAKHFPDRPAFDFIALGAGPGKRYTYAALLSLVDRAAAGFQEMGVGPGTRVGLILPNCPYYPIAFFAVLKAGGTVVNFNPLYTEREIGAQMRDSGVTIMVSLDLAPIYAKVEAQFGHTGLATIVLCPMADILPFPKSALYPLVKRHDVARPADRRRILRFSRLTRGTSFKPVAIDPESDVALLQYTGGTTGVPKGAMLTHANVYANSVQAVMWLAEGREGREKLLAVIPFFHVFAMTAAMMFSVKLGAELIALPRFDATQVLKTIQKRKPTFFPAVPTIYNALVHHPDQKDYDLSSIKYCISGGAPLPVEVKESFEKQTGCTLIEGYGLSETSPIATVNPLVGGKTGSIGLPVPRTVIEIISLEDGVTPVQPGEKGEICISGPQVMKGYWNQPDETAHAMRGGRFHTGDIGTMDDEGFTFIVDRLKDIIIAGGFKIYPRIVEEAVYQHAAVEECIVAGVPDEYRGQTVKLWVKLREGAILTAPELKTFLAGHLSAIEMPKLIEFRDEPLPKTLIGKLSRKAILEEDAKRQ